MAQATAAILRDTTRLRAVAKLRDVPLLLYGVVLICFGMAAYLFGVAMAVPRYLFGLNHLLMSLNEWIVWYSGMPVMAGFLLAGADIVFLLPGKRRPADVRFDLVDSRSVTVALTAYNDEQSIGAAVQDFLAHPLVAQVVVVSNNSMDRTLAYAEAARAVTFNEPAQGYGHCVHRCLTEAARLSNTDLVVLCEGDCTFRAYDLDKLLSYIPHADIVNGTRTVERLRQYRT